MDEHFSIAMEGVFPLHNKTEEHNFVFGSSCEGILEEFFSFEKLSSFDAKRNDDPVEKKVVLPPSWLEASQEPVAQQW